MAIKKATTTSDLTAEEFTAKAENPQPTREEMVARVQEHTADEMLAESADVKYVKVKSPAGDVTEVPEVLVDALLESGYTKGSAPKTDSK
jgi:hypothetical protein